MAERGGLSPQALEFAPGLLAIQESPPRRLPRTVLYAVVALFVTTLAWMIFGRLDIVATAEGRLVPKTYVKIVQPAKAGIVSQILVHEDEHVRAGEVLLRMDPHDADADTAALKAELALRSLELRRIDAELDGRRLKRRPGDPAELYQEVDAQLATHRQAYEQSSREARDALVRARRDYAAARQVLKKLGEIAPILKQQAASYDSMGKAGYAPMVSVREKDLQYLEKAQDLLAERDTVAGLRAAVAQARAKLEAVRSRYRAGLRDEWVKAERDDRALKRRWAKQMHKDSLLALRAPQSGIVENLATHTVGTVVEPGTVLLSLVPDREPLVAVVRFRNRDIGFVHLRQKARVKVVAYPFEKYGTLDGEVMQISPDTEGARAARSGARSSSGGSPQQAPPTYKAVVALGRQSLDAHGRDFRLLPGMLVSAEVDEGRRSVMQYLLSPVEKTLEDSGRER